MSSRPSGPERTLRGARALLVPASVLMGLTLESGCAKVCDDDGFAWQQDPSCLAQNETGEPTTESDDTQTPTETPTSTMPGEGGSWCTDGDGDGFGDADNCTDVPEGETPPEGTVPNDDDCADDDPNTFPGSAPNDSETACMTDADGDDWGDMDPPGGADGGVEPGTDCDDSNPDTFPGSAEEDSPDACMKDEDGDGHGDDNPPQSPDGTIEPGTDCDDGDGANFDMCSTCVDEDGDGWFSGCDESELPPDKPTLDCVDTDPNTFPGAAPNDSETACMTDEDGDDWGDDTPSSPEAVPGTDCDDQNDAAFPGSAPKDSETLCTTDADDDDWGDDTPSSPEAVPGTDCDDQNDAAFPGSAPKDSETACMADEDDDDHGDATPDNPNVTPGNDCNDNHSQINPTDSQLITVPDQSGEILEVSLADGGFTPIATLDVTSFLWTPTSTAINADRSVYVALQTLDRIVTMNYCGGGVPTALPVSHNKDLCGIAFDGDGTLWGIDSVTDELVKFNADLQGGLDDTFGNNGGVEIQFEGVDLNIAQCGMTWDCHQERLLFANSGTDAIYAIDPADGTATLVASVPDASFGAGLAYEPVSKQALSCFGTSFFSIALDGSNAFTPLPDLQMTANDLEYGPGCI